MYPSQDLSSRWSLHPGISSTASRRRQVLQSQAAFILTTTRIGNPHTLHHFLSAHLPLLFPSRPSPSISSRVNPPIPELAYALVQGVLTPPEAEMAWLGSCLAGADGWLNICIGLNRG